jgi:hypothetical protein
MNHGSHCGPAAPGSRLDADHPENGVLIPRRFTISNGSSLLPGVDGRSGWVRRLRDLINLHLSDLGGIERVSEAEKSIVRRIATLTVELERMEAAFATAGQATPDQLDLYQRTANSLRRLLESVGLKRVPRDVTPSVAQYIANIEKADAE